MDYPVYAGRLPLSNCYYLGDLYGSQSGATCYKVAREATSCNQISELRYDVTTIAAIVE